MLPPNVSSIFQKLLLGTICSPSSICSSESSVHPGGSALLPSSVLLHVPLWWQPSALSMSMLLLLPTHDGSVLLPHECVLLHFLSTPGGSILLPHECLSSDPSYD